MEQQGKSVGIQFMCITLAHIRIFNTERMNVKYGSFNTGYSQCFLTEDRLFQL